ncbi:MAG: NUDIX hydrolase [Phycisphaerales bacterium]
MAKRKSANPESKPAHKGSARNISTPPAARPKGDHHIELIVRGVWVHDGKVLLCRNVGKGYLYLPGGHIEFGESAANALKREFLEECGVEVDVRGLILATEGAFEAGKRWHHEINLVFQCSARNIKVKSREPEIAFDWVDLAAVVDLDLRPLGVKAWLAAGPGQRVEWVSELR